MRDSLRIPLVALLLTPGLLSQDVPVFHEDATLATVPCVVMDEGGRTIDGLRAEDFRLYAGGIRQKIDHLWREDDLPLRLGVIDDVSESQRARIAAHERALTQLLTQAVHREDRAFVVAVNDKVTLRSEVSAGPYGLRYRFLPPGGEPLGEPCGTLDDGHGRQRSLCGGTALWNAVFASARLKLSGPGGNKALLILSDGNDTGSTHDFGEALEAVQRSGAVVYAIQYRDALSQGDAPAGLRRLTEITGGMLFDLTDMDYPEIVARIAADLHGRYILGFRPEWGGGNETRRALRVEVRRSGAAVRTRREYLEPLP